MNEADRLFIAEHKKHIEKTLLLISSTIDGDEPGDAAKIGVATLIMNVYSGMEVLLRHILSDKGIEIAKSGAWHKEILSQAVSFGIISNELQGQLMQYLLFRHRHVHGYGYMLEWEKLKPLAGNIVSAANSFFSAITSYIN